MEWGSWSGSWKHREGGKELIYVQVCICERTLLARKVVKGWLGAIKVEHTTTRREYERYFLWVKRKQGATVLVREEEDCYLLA